jgi:hypothetical protein
MLWVPTSFAGGITSSIVNGEFGPWWGVFVSFDTFVVAGVSLAVAGLLLARRAPSTSASMAGRDTVVRG